MLRGDAAGRDPEGPQMGGDRGVHPWGPFRERKGVMVWVLVPSWWLYRFRKDAERPKGSRMDPHEPPWC